MLLANGVLSSLQTVDTATKLLDNATPAERPQCRGPVTRQASTGSILPVSVSRTRRAVAVLAFILTMMLLVATRANAHAILTASSPTDGASLGAAPTSMTLTFDEQVLSASADMTLFSGQGAVLARSGSGLHRLGIVGTSRTGPSILLTVSLPPLGAGAFALSWQVQSADDLHSSSGSVVFGVMAAVRPTVPDREGTLPATDTTLLRWMDLVLLAVILGVLLLAAGVLPRSDMAALDRLVWLSAGRRVLRGSSAVAVLMAAATLIDSTGGIHPVGYVLMATPFGHLWLVHVAGLVGVFVLSRITTRRPGGLMIWWAALASVAGLAADSHVGTGGDRPLAAALLAVHLAAGCGWAGAVVLLSLAATQSRFGGQIIVMVKAFAAPAAACAATVIITGLTLGAKQVASADALISSSYGRVLLVKVGLAGAAGLLGLATYVRFRRVRRSDDPVTPIRLARLAAIEGLVLVLVLASAAVLSLSSPPRGLLIVPSVPNQQAPLVNQVDGLLLALDVTPDGAGSNWVRVTVDDTRRPARSVVRAVTAVVAGPDGQVQPALDLAKVGNSDLWQLSGVGSGQPGPWRIALSVHRLGMPNATWGQELTTYSVISPSWPLAGVLNYLAAFLALCCIGAIAARRRRCGAAHGATRVPLPEKELLSLDPPT